MSGRELQRAVIDLAHLFGWSVAHFRPGRVLRHGKEIYETPVAADGKGWPDLVLCKDRSDLGMPGLLLFRELKGDGDRLRPEQAAWIARLQAARQDAKVWTAKDWRSGAIEKELRG